MYYNGFNDIIVIHHTHQHVTMLENFLHLSRIYLQENNHPYHRASFDDPRFLSHRLSILSGPRGVGKTTLIVQKLLSHVENQLLSSKILYIPSDHFLVGQSALYTIAEAFVQSGGKYLALDEIHKYPNWSEELKSIYDTYPELTLLVSGSSLIEIHKGSHDLTRRAIVYGLEGLSFREYLGLIHNIHFENVNLEDIFTRHEHIAHEISQQLKILPLFKAYLSQGYFPYFLDIKDKESYYLTLEQNINATIETDIPAVYPNLTGHSLRKIKQILIFLSQHVPFKPNYKKLQYVAEIADLRTLKTYLTYLENAQLIRHVRPAGSKFNTIEQAEKIYLHNPNQYHALSQSPNMGTLRELFFICATAHLAPLSCPKAGDFLIDGKLVEIGGRKKDFSQIKDHPNAYLVSDDLEVGIGQRIPLWLFGFTS